MNETVYQARKTLCVLCLCFICSSAFGAPSEHDAKLWTQINVDGPFFNTKLNYLLELHARFQDTSKPFEQAVTRLGFSYDINPIASVWLGYDFTPTRGNVSKQFENEHRPWQQLYVKAIHQGNFSLDSRTRLEQRFSENEPGTAYRLRQQFTIKLPNIVGKKITPVLSEEIFFNLNHPSWVNEDSVDQNRIFAGFQFAVLRLRPK